MKCFKVNGGFLLGLFNFDNPTPIKSQCYTCYTLLHFKKKSVTGSKPLFKGIL